MKLKGRRFDTIEIQAEMQVLLDTLTEKGLQEAFQTWRQWDRCLHAEKSYFEGDGGQ
jgi:hypothetical protein